MDDSLFRTGEELPGTVYRVLRHLATGGMGSVYEVEDVTVGKKYVLKTLHPQLVDREDLARRMKDEARTLAKLQHANIVDVVTAGVTKTARPIPFYVMERLTGYNLRHYLEKKGALDLVPAYRIAIDVLDALEHAHDNAVVHRDVKPENIFLHHNANGTATTKLLDFGIMRMLDRKTSHTHGKFIGTLRYASPEQLVGGELGPASDIYSLGVVLFEMIAGRGPFDEAGSAMAIGRAHAEAPAPSLSRFLRVPPSLDRLVASALAKDPASRPRDCFTFASELRRLWREHESAPHVDTEVASVHVWPGSSYRRDGAMGAVDVADGAHAPPTAQTPRGAGVAPAASGLSPPAAETRVRGIVQVSPYTQQDDSVSHAAHAPTKPSSPGHPVVPVPPAPLPVDRNAETRASGGHGHTLRLAPNGTLVDEADRTLRALGEPAPHPRDPIARDARRTGGEAPSGSRAIAGSRTTGPVEGEIAPPTPARTSFVTLAIAGVSLGVLVTAGVVSATKPWARRGGLPTSASPVASTTATSPTGATTLAPPLASTTARPSVAPGTPATDGPAPSATVPGSPSYEPPRGAPSAKPAASSPSPVAPRAAVAGRAAAPVVPSPTGTAPPRPSARPALSPHDVPMD